MEEEGELCLEGGLSGPGSTLNTERTQALGEPEEDMCVVRGGPQKRDQRAETSWEACRTLGVSCSIHTCSPVGLLEHVSHKVVQLLSLRPSCVCVGGVGGW